MMDVFLQLITSVGLTDSDAAFQQTMKKYVGQNSLLETQHISACVEGASAPSGDSHFLQEVDSANPVFINSYGVEFPVQPVVDVDLL